MIFRTALDSTEFSVLYMKLPSVFFIFHLNYKMNRLNLLAIAIAALTLFASCSATKEPAGVWVNTEKIKGKSFNKIFIVVMTADIEARSVIENDLAAAAREKGYNV